MSPDERLAEHYRRRDRIAPLEDHQADHFPESRLDHTGYFETNHLLKRHRKYYRERKQGTLTIQPRTSEAFFI